MAIPGISTNDRERFVVRADEKLTAFLELERLRVGRDSVSILGPFNSVEAVPTVASMLHAWRFFRPVRAHGFAWKITGERSGVRILDNFQRFIE